MKYRYRVPERFSSIVRKRSLRMDPNLGSQKVTDLAEPSRKLSKTDICTVLCALSSTHTPSPRPHRLVGQYGEHTARVAHLPATRPHHRAPKLLQQQQQQYHSGQQGPAGCGATVDGLQGRGEPCCGIGH